MPSILSSKLLQRFNDEYTRLNSRQKEAVDQIDGPVMVIAGPGTGKTQILSARIGKILLETDTQPENILCLTYTDAGVTAMKKRLLALIGPEAYKVNVYTFHAFCNDVIQDNLSLFEKTSLDLISELERIQLVKSMIDELPRRHPLKRYRGDAYYEVANMLSLFSLMKQEGWTAGYVDEKIDEYLSDLPTRDEYIYKNSNNRCKQPYKKGDIKQAQLDKEIDRMEKLRAAAKEFPRFQQLMRDKNRYDFDDMILWVINAFRENNSLLLSYQEKFQYVLVDEYQDTSGTQNMLVQLLINYWDQPNIFVVGDDDQSIFRFQGANFETMWDFRNSYADDLKTIVLTNNYRSVQPILDISKTLIDKNSERLVNRLEGLTKNLVASRESLRHIKDVPEIRAYESERHEMIDVTLRVEELLASGIPPGKIAVIYSENKYGQNLMRYFKLKKIPFYSKRKIDLLHEPFAARILQILKYLALEHDVPFSGDHLLFEILHFDFYNIPPMEIAKITVECNARQHKDELTSIRKLIHDKAHAPAKTLFDVPFHPALTAFSKVFEKLIRSVSNETLQMLFEQVIREAGVLSYIMKAEEKIWYLQVLTGLFDFIKDETRRNPDLNVQQLIATINLMEEHDLPLPLLETSGTEAGVNLLTVHGSKGLEYEYIFFVGCNASCWESKKLSRTGYKLPDNMFSSQYMPTDEEEKRRLFYVALTRAERYLFISYCNCRPDGKSSEASKFIAEIRDGHELPIHQEKIDDRLLSEFSILEFLESKPEIDKAEEDVIQGILDKFVMNSTALNNYLNCPLSFYFQNLIQIPCAKAEPLEFGSAIHFALQKLFEKMLADPSHVLPPASVLVEDFQWYMHRHRENFTTEGYKRRLEFGEDTLTNYYNKYNLSWSRKVAVEKNIRNVVVYGVPIKGKIDKLEYMGGNMVTIVDYKTGNYKNGRPKTSPANDQNPLGGDYWRQAIFYKILLENSYKKKFNVVRTEFDFVEPDDYKNYQKITIEIEPAAVEKVTEQIVTTWQKIQDRDSYTGCGKETCHWCNFVKDNKLAVTLHPPDEDGDDSMDDIHKPFPDLI